MEPILISACLLGAACRYDGGSNPVLSVEALMGRTPSILLALLLVAAIIWVVQVKGSEIQPFIYFKF